MNFCLKKKKERTWGGIGELIKWGVQTRVTLLLKATNLYVYLLIESQMKTIRMAEHWQERDSGQGSVSNPSHHSNNNSNGNLHAQQLGNLIPEPASTSVGSPIDRSSTNAAINAAVVLSGGCASVNKVTANQAAIHQQPIQLHEPSHDGQICTRKPAADSIRTYSPFPTVVILSSSALRSTIDLFSPPLHIAIPYTFNLLLQPLHKRFPFAGLLFRT